MIYQRQRLSWRVTRPHITETHCSFCQRTPTPIRFTSDEESGSLYYTLGRARCVDVCPRIGELLYRRVRQEPGAKGGTYVGPP